MLPGAWTQLCLQVPPALCSSPGAIRVGFSFAEHGQCCRAHLSGAWGWGPPQLVCVGHIETSDVPRFIVDSVSSAPAIILLHFPPQWREASGRHPGRGIPCFPAELGPGGHVCRAGRSLRARGGQLHVGLLPAPGPAPPRRSLDQKTLAPAAVSPQCPRTV